MTPPPPPLPTTGYCSAARPGYGRTETCRDRPGTKIQWRIKKQEARERYNLPAHRGLVFAPACLIYKHYINITPLSLHVLHETHFQLGNNLTGQMISNGRGWGRSVGKHCQQSSSEAKTKDKLETVEQAQRNAFLGCPESSATNNPRIKGVELWVLPSKATVSETRCTNVLKWSVVWWSGYLATQRTAQGGCLFFLFFWDTADRAAELMGIICCVTGMIITEQAAVRFSWLSVWVKAAVTAEKGVSSLQKKKGGGDKALSAIQPSALLL